MDVLPGELQLVMVGELGYLLDHLFELFFGGGAHKAGGFYLEVAVFEDKLAEVEAGALLEEHLKVKGGREVADLGAEDDLLAAGYAALLGKGEYSLKAVAVDRHNNDRLGMVIVCELPADLVGVLFEGRKKVHAVGF